MKFDKTTKRANATIAGKEFSVPQPFTKGYALSDNEASALNQLVIENTRNNFAGRIKRATEDKKPQPTQADLDAYLADYNFGERRATTGDPVEREAIALSEGHVRKAIVKAGKKLADYSAKDIRAKALDTLAKNPKLRDQAAAIVKQREAIGGSALEVAI